MSRAVSNMMKQWMSVTFLGTCSGGGPSDSRNCSSLVLDIIGNGSLWMVDCAEGTYRQFCMQPPCSRHNSVMGKTVKATKVNNIFITHLHADHIMGLITFLRQTLGYPTEGNTSPGASRAPLIHIYGPKGIRRFVRSNLLMTSTRTAEAYAVHELLKPHDEVTPCEPLEVRHRSEAVGRDIICDEHGFWRQITSGKSNRGSICVHAGSIEHRDPCIGYVFNEPVSESNNDSVLRARKLVVLGDTNSPASLTPLVTSIPGRLVLLVHEATDAYIPEHVDKKLAAKRNRDKVERLSTERGHSTPQKAGSFAGLWGAERLVLNHIGTRFPAARGNSPGQELRRAILQEIEHQASEAWANTSPITPSIPSSDLIDRRVIAAYDFLKVEIPPLEVPSSGSVQNSSS